MKWCGVEVNPGVSVGNVISVAATLLSGAAVCATALWGAAAWSGQTAQSVADLKDQLAKFVEANDKAQKATGDRVDRIEDREREDMREVRRGMDGIQSRLDSVIAGRPGGAGPSERAPL